MNDKLVLSPGRLVKSPYHVGRFVVVPQAHDAPFSLAVGQNATIGSADDCSIVVSGVARHLAMIEVSEGRSVLTVLDGELVAYCNTLEIVSRSDIDVSGARVGSSDPEEAAAARYRDAILAFAQKLPGALVSTEHGPKLSVWSLNALAQLVEENPDDDEALEVDPTELWVTPASESSPRGQATLKPGDSVELLGLAETILMLGGVPHEITYDDDRLTAGIW